MHPFYRQPRCIRLIVHGMSDDVACEYFLIPPASGADIQTEYTVVYPSVFQGATMLTILGKLYLMNRKNRK